MSNNSSFGNLFKFAGPEVAEKVLPVNGGAVFRCSYPKDFNDPYELFLSIDRHETPELLAFYADVVGDLPQIPTTCFSRSPIVLPMWAHYASNGSGFVVEVDESRIVARFPKAGFGDVDYRDAADPELNSLLERAHETTKPRHTYILRDAVFSAAYYTKANCWSHEQERRLVAGDASVRMSGDLMLLDVPPDAVRRLIAGPSSSDRLKAFLREAAARLGCGFLKMRRARTSTRPYFVDSHAATQVFEAPTFVEVVSCCEGCGEPIDGDGTRCSLCSVDREHREWAARRNPYRMLQDTGLLDGYIANMNGIRKGSRDPKTKGSCIYDSIRP